MNKCIKIIGYKHSRRRDCVFERLPFNGPMCERMPFIFQKHALYLMTYLILFAILSICNIKGHIGEIEFLYLPS